MKFLLTSVLLLSALSSQADIVEFSAPAEYCFPQTSVRSELGKFDRVFLDHNLIVNEQDHFKTGDVFVGFWRKGQPDTIWLTDGTSWFNIADNSKVTSKAYSAMLPSGDGKLQPVMPITLSRGPIDVSGFVGEGEVWIGYGLRAEGETWEKSYEDMISNQRFDIVWEIAGPTAVSGLPSDLPAICLMVAGMRTTSLPTSLPHGVAVTSGENTMVITEVLMTLEDIDLEGKVGSPNIEGPVLVRLNLAGDGLGTPIEIEVPPDTYKEISFDISVPDGGEPAQVRFLERHPYMSDVSMRIRGTFNSSQFDFGLDLRGDLEIPFKPLLRVESGQKSLNVEIQFDVASWFVREDGTLMDPRLICSPDDDNYPPGCSPEDRTTVEQNIERSIQAYSDN